MSNTCAHDPARHVLEDIRFKAARQRFGTAGIQLRNTTGGVASSDGGGRPLADQGFHSLPTGLPQGLMDQLPDPIFVVRPVSGKTIYCNAATFRHLEVSCDEELQGARFGSLFDPRELPGLVKRLASAGSLLVETVHRTGRGRYIPVELSLSLLQSGDVVGAVHNISQRTQQLARMQLDRARLQAILESTSVAVTTLTLEGYVASWNGAAERMFGWTAAEVLLRPSPFSADPSLLALTSEVLEQRATRAFATQRRCKDGSWVKVALSLCPLLTETGQISGLLERAEDITDKVNAELLDANRRLLDAREAERMRLARELHDGVLQDLICIGFSLAELGGRLTLKSPVPEEADPLVQQRKAVLLAARHLREVVTELRPPGLTDCSLVSALEGLAEKLTGAVPQAPRMKLDLQEIPELSQPQQLCLFRSAQEALHNCLKHAHADQVTMSLRRVGGNAEFAVLDDGCGFVVAKDAQTMTAASHFGLAGMAERAQLANATFSVKSRLNHGSEVRLTVPLPR